MARQDTKLETEGAEFLVLGQLLIEGIPAYKAYSNLRGHDIVAHCPETNRSARIQVKCRWATNAGHFSINKFECDFVVLTRLNRGYRFSGRAKQKLNEKADPEYYVLPVDVARAKARTKGWGYIVWRKEEFEEYRRRWDLIQKFLQQSQQNNVIPGEARKRRGKGI